MPHYYPKTSPARSTITGQLEWDGSTDGDWSDITNWAATLARQYSSGETRRFTSGAVDVDKGLNNSGDIIDGLYVGEGYTGDIAPGGLLIINIVDVLIRKAKGVVRLAGNLDNVYVSRCASTDPAVYLDSSADLIQNLVILEAPGQVELGFNSNVTNIVCCPRKGKYVRLKIGAGCTIASMRCYGATEIVSASGTSTELVVVGPSAGTFTAGTHADVTLAQDALVDYEAADDISGDVTVASGAWFRTKENVDTALTIAGLQLYRGGVVDLRSRTRNVTVTNGADCYGGRVLLDHGQTADV